MDEYSFQNYHNFPQSDHLSDLFLNDSLIQQKINSQNMQFENSQFKEEKDDTFATNLTCSSPPSNCQKIQNIQSTQTLLSMPKKENRKIRKIQTSSRIQILNKFTFSGSKNDTVELNTNNKTLFKKFIRQSVSHSSLQEPNVLMQFEKRVSSFKAFSQLYESNQEIKNMCTQLIRSSRIVNKVLRSRAKFWMRLQMIKYIQALNRNLQSDILVRWKSIRKQTKSKE